MCQSDFIKPSDFEDNPPKFPKVVMPSFSSYDSVSSDSTEALNIFTRGYRIQVMISQNENELITLKNNLEQSINHKIYIIFELPNYKLRIGNFINRKEIREGIACVKHQNMAGSDMGDYHKEYFAGEAALKASGDDNTMNQF